VEGQRERVNAVLRRQLVSGITTLRAAGDWPATQALAQRCLELDPLNEEATLALAEAMAMDGSKARAIMLIERYMNEVGPRSKELYLPATTLKKRISELYPLPPVIEREPPHTGREEQMELLDAALKDARQGRGSAFLISGPPGMGKTRLVTEFTRAAQLQGIATARSQMGRHDDHRPLGAWSDVVPTLQRMAGALGCDPESLPFLRRLTTYDASQTTPSPETQDAEYLFARMRMSIIDLVCAVASESCVILLVEDVHWMDEWSWDVMTALTKKLEKVGVVILMTRRDGEEPSTPVPNNAALRDIELEPLVDSKCRKLLSYVIPPAKSGDQPYADWCVKSCGGNPYFLIELGRRTSREEGKFIAPPNLARLLAQRLLDVTPLARRVFQVCALLARNASIDRIERVLAERRISVLDAIDELARHSLIVADASRITCTHDLLGISIVSDFSSPTIRAIRRHVAIVMEADAGEPPTASYLWDCASHWDSLGESEQAIRVLERCAQQAASTGASMECVRALNRAIELMPAGRQRDQLQERRLLSLHAAGEHAELVACAEHYRTQSRQARSEIHSKVELCELEAESYLVGPTGALLIRASRCARDVSAEASHRLEAGLLAVMLAEGMNEPVEAQVTIESIRPLLDDETSIPAALVRMIYEGSFGSSAASASEARRIDRLLEHSQLTRNVRARILLQCSTAHVIGGDANRIEQTLSECIEIARDLGLPKLARWAHEKFSDWYLSLGDYDNAQMHIALIENATQLNDLRGRATRRNIARIALSKGDLAEAERLLGAFETPFSAESPLERYYATEVRARFLLRARRWVPSDDEMKRLLEIYRGGRAIMGEDLFAVALIEAYEARCEFAQIPLIIQEHLTVRRRTMNPLAPDLSGYVQRYSVPET
jgi:hypothetical protein